MFCGLLIFDACFLYNKNLSKVFSIYKVLNPVHFINFAIPMIDKTYKYNDAALKRINLNAVRLLVLLLLSMVLFLEYKNQIEATPMVIVLSLAIIATFMWQYLGPRFNYYRIKNYKLSVFGFNGEQDSLEIGFIEKISSRRSKGSFDKVIGYQNGAGRKGYISIQGSFSSKEILIYPKHVNELIDDLLSINPNIVVEVYGYEKL